MGYAQKENRRINVIALINSIIGIPVIIFSIFLVSKGFLSDYLIIVVSCLLLLSIGVFYSLFKIIIQIKKRENVDD
jgi:hypothetical protein